MSTADHTERQHDFAIRSRFDLFLQHLTGPLLTAQEQDRMLEVFRGLTEECLKDAAAIEGWSSELCTDGAPIEFSICIDNKANVTFSYVVDPWAGTRDVLRSDQCEHAWANLVVPYRETCSELVDELLGTFRATIPDVTRSYVGFGARFAPGTVPAGRIYFKASERPVELVYTLLSVHLEQDDVELLQRYPLGGGNIIGIGYDFLPAGLGRVKVYVLVDRMPREASLVLLKDVLGTPRTGMQTILDKISRQRHPFWIIPPTIVSVGFRPGTSSRDLKFSFSAAAWEWATFRDLWPVVSSVLTEWDAPVAPEISTQCMVEPQWRFAPTLLCISGSEKTENLSFYFRPLGKEYSSIESVPSVQARQADTHRAIREESLHGAWIFEMMYKELLQSDA